MIEFEEIEGIRQQYHLYPDYKETKDIQDYVISFFENSDVEHIRQQLKAAIVKELERFKNTIADERGDIADFMIDMMIEHHDDAFEAKCVLVENDFEDTSLEEAVNKYIDLKSAMPDYINDVSSAIDRLNDTVDTLKDEFECS